jgi:hypothetical protein
VLSYSRKIRSKTNASTVKKSQLGNRILDWGWMRWNRVCFILSSQFSTIIQRSCIYLTCSIYGCHGGDCEGYGLLVCNTVSFRRIPTFWGTYLLLLLVWCLISTLKTEAKYSSETSLTFQTTWCYSTEGILAFHVLKKLHIQYLILFYYVL